MNKNDQFIIVLVIVIAASAIVVLNDLLIRRSVRRAERRKLHHPRDHRDNKTNWGILLTWLIAMPLLAYVALFTDWLRRLDFALGGTKTMTLMFVGLVVALFAAVGARFALLHWRHRHFRAALRLVREGHADTAVAMLRDQLRRPGPTAEILNAIAVIYCEQQEWDKALQAICELQGREEENPAFLANKGLILWKLGRLEEALELLRQAHSHIPGLFPIACNYGLLLAETGQTERAEEVLARAERMLFQSRAARLAHTNALRDIRERIASARQDPQ